MTYYFSLKASIKNKNVGCILKKLARSIKELEKATGEKVIFEYRGAVKK